MQSVSKEKQFDLFYLHFLFLLRKSSFLTNGEAERVFLHHKKKRRIGLNSAFVSKNGLNDPLLFLHDFTVSYEHWHVRDERSAEAL